MFENTLPLDFGPECMEGAVMDDPQLEEVWHYFTGQPDYVSRFGCVLRQAIDEVLDGQRTGRYDINGENVASTEKTYLGTKVEIVTRAEFSLGFGSVMDYEIAGCPVDAKFTLGRNWTIPLEAVGHICLLMRADDAGGEFQVGLLRISDQRLNQGKNRDQKRTISKTGRADIRWLVPEGSLPRNLLLNLSRTDPQIVHEIFAASDSHRGSGNGGQLRVNELLRRVQGQIIDRNTAITVASQHDGPKRIRDARRHLQPEGIVVLGHQKDGPRVARELGLPIPFKGSWVSTTLSLPPIGDRRPATRIGNIDYVVRGVDDPVITAPLIWQ
ncbi:restriction endonuclease [Nocardia sp. 2]|uniref:Restriction endonuclease n=1 Tax=Nocardia acididurans TaxID=2802282 RepID=A0ABS1MH64_9NOCA|nr:NaeI family type II restriction endonuclease [Nocardia acididurans]MBL1080008.1 restriction endonuclease [Nocardia acididurans]